MSEGELLNSWICAQLRIEHQIEWLDEMRRNWERAASQGFLGNIVESVNRSEGTDLTLDELIAKRLGKIAARIAEIELGAQTTYELLTDADKDAALLWKLSR